MPVEANVALFSLQRVLMASEKNTFNQGHYFGELC